MNTNQTNQVSTFRSASRRTTPGSMLALAAALFASSMSAVSPAFAQAAAGFDPGTVLAGIAAMVAAGILIYTAWTAAKWTLKAFGIIAGK